MPTVQQISAGGVAFRRMQTESDASGSPAAPAGPAGEHARVEVALIRVGPQGRWQLPKGLINAGETPETAALREVAEEAGIRTRLLAPIDIVEYWYYGQRGAQKVRYHKQVHFFLLQYVAGDVADHDGEVEEARWVELARAKTMLSFAGERKVLEKAETLLDGLPGEAPEER